ncbi:MAG: phenylalanine--tRNA ligase subunit beta [Syntrophobacterales bacterium]|jgi:phenylalanyl-tRNA synthetase beta chain|nr:phenylalanine--tRNA ligase subunit beta [Syntrophobacterales bacterium]
MLVSIKWLKDYVDFDLTPAELAHKLTMAGLEVDGIEQKGPSFAGVVVGKILSIAPHPNADKLSLCVVSTGKKNYSVVCGAPNIKEGMLAPFAMVGATIPGGYTIKRSQIRGEFSEGMLCSEGELEIGDDSTGIMALPDHLPLGQELAHILDLTDVVLDVSITANRSDCLSMIGFAREIAALTNGQVKYPHISLQEGSDKVHDMTSVTIEDPDLCPHYTARVLKNVKIAPSPFWMKQRLEAVGIRAINNVVDVTNYVMMEFGQPLHAFDFRFLEEGRIVVRRSRQDETFVSLDEKERILRKDTLMICDGKKPAAIAGIMGGLNSEIKDDTETVFLESAYFLPTSIRKSARWLGMQTDASYRFERGIDPQGVVKSLERAAQLIQQTAGAAICKGIVDEYPRKSDAVKTVSLRTSHVNRILGASLTDEVIVDTLTRLNMGVTKTGEQGVYLVHPPSYRVDTDREIDLIEEIARLVGYDQIAPRLSGIAVQPLTKKPKEILTEKVSSILTGCGFSEVIHYSFVTPKSCRILNIPSADKRTKMLKIANPLSDDHSVMRSTLVYSLLNTMKTNANNGCHNLKIFEIGKTFIDVGRRVLPLEKEYLSGLMTGLTFGDFWHLKDSPADFYSLKGVMEDLLETLKISPVDYDTSQTEPYLHPGRSCAIFVNRDLLGFLGELHPQVQSRMDLKNRTLVFELEIDMLCRHFTDQVRYHEISRYPSVTRDVSLLIQKNIDVAKIMSISKSVGEEWLEKVNPFDIYEGEGVPQGMKSMGIRFSYRSPERTLKDEEVNTAHRNIVNHITRATGAKIRGENT